MAYFRDAQRHAHKQDTFCAFCRTPRKRNPKKHVTMINITSSLMGAVALTLIMWQEFHPVGVIFFIIGIILAEIYIQLKWRISVVCRTCGFDPVLYLKNPESTAKKVKEHLSKRKSNPLHMLSKPVHLPAISADKAKAIQNKDKKGQLVSRQI